MKNLTTIFSILITSTLIYSCVTRQATPRSGPCVPTKNTTTTKRNPNSMAFTHVGKSSNFKHLTYTPTAYSVDKCIPDYNLINSWAFFTMFGDGRYSWCEAPEHEYRKTDTYPNFLVEHTKVKNNGGKPPVSIVNPLDDHIIKVCESDPNSKDNIHQDLGNRSIAFNRSRPMFCGYTFVQIIKLDPSKFGPTKQVIIEYNSDDLKLEKFIEYMDMPYSVVTPTVISTTDYNRQLLITINGTHTIDGEIPIFLQFLTTCEGNGVKGIYDGKLNVRMPGESFGSDLNQDLNFSAQKDNPFDPNWLFIDHTICKSSDYQIHRLSGFFYHYDMGSTPRKVEVKVNELSNQLHRIVGNNLATDFYPRLQTSNQRSLIYESCPSFPLTKPCSKFYGVGGTRTRNSVLEEITFDIILKPNVSRPIELQFISHFEGVDIATTKYIIPIDSLCEPDPQYFYDISSENHGGVITNPDIGPLGTNPDSPATDDEYEVDPNIIEVDPNIINMPVDSL